MVIPFFFLQKNLIPDIQCLPQALRHFLADRAFTVFHFADMALGDAGQFRKLNLRQSFAISRPSQRLADKLCFRAFRVSIAPRDRIGRVMIACLPHIALFKQVGMCSSSFKDDHVPVKPVNQKPVRFNTAFPPILEITD